MVNASRQVEKECAVYITYRVSQTSIYISKCWYPSRPSGGAIRWEYVSCSCHEALNIFIIILVVQQLSVESIAVAVCKDNHGNTKVLLKSDGDSGSEQKPIKLDATTITTATATTTTTKAKNSNKTVADFLSP